MKSNKKTKKDKRSIKAFKIQCLPLTNVKRDYLWERCVEYAQVYNHISKFLPSLPEWYWKSKKIGHLYSKYITKGKGNIDLKINTNVIKSSEKLYAIQDAVSNYKSTISNNKNSRKGLKIQEMKPNILKFDNKRYQIIKKNDEYGIFIKSDKIFIPIVVGDFEELQWHLDMSIECDTNPGVITYNFRENTISIPHRFGNERKMVKKDKIKTIIGVDLGVNNQATLSAIQIDSNEPIVKGIEIYSGSNHKHRIKRLQKKNNALKSKKKPITHNIRNIQDTSSHQLSKKIVDFALKFENPAVIFENLKSIKEKQKRVKNGGQEGKGKRRMLSSWNYGELRTKTEYKLNAEGIWSIEIDPRYTSQRCSKCNAMGIRTGSTFRCESCGFGCGSTPQGTISGMNADVNASINIALTGLYVLYGHKEGTVAVPNGSPNENVRNPIPTEVNGIDGKTLVEARSLEKQTIVCS